MRRRPLPRRTGTGVAKGHGAIGGQHVLHHFAETLADFQRVLRADQPEADFCRAQIYAAAGREKEAKELIGSLEDDVSKIDNVFRGLALVYSALGDIDKALEMIEKSLEVHEIALLSIKVDPKLDAVRADPRFSELLKKLGVTPVESAL